MEKNQVRRMGVGLVIVFLFALSVAPMSVWAQAKPIVLEFASYLPPGMPSLEVIRKFFGDLEGVTNGLVKTRFHLSSAMGKPADHYELALKGVADVAYIGTSYTPGSFPTVEIFDLPMANASAENIDRTLIEMYKMGYFTKEFSNVKLIVLDSISPYQLFWAKEKVDTIAAIKGKKIRATGNYVPRSLKAFGGIPVFVPVPDTYLAMQKGTVDGTIMPYGGVKDFNLQEVTKYITEINSFYFIYGLVMNTATWERLPEKAKNFINENGMNLSIKCGMAWDAFCIESKNIYLKSGGKIINLVPGEAEKMDKLLAPIWTEWISSQESKGFPAKKQASDLFKILNSLGVKEPFIGYRP